MVSFTKINAFTKALIDGKHDFSTHTFKVALTNTSPTAATDDELADITQISNGNGYTTGGTATTMSTSTSSGTAKATGTDVVFTATGSMGPFRYAVLYNDTTAGDPLVGYWDYGSSITLANTETFTVDFDGTNGILTVA